ncbi:MAG: protein phosphatase 2C domain-containing protein [Anaerolineae bacterium]|nr:protein phosphatase 2C domain-containing protein [Anaerolineae bacterium]
MTKCPNCGRENREAARFCQHCGALLETVAISEVVELDEVGDELAAKGASLENGAILDQPESDLAVDDAEAVVDATIESSVKVAVDAVAESSVEQVTQDAVADAVGASETIEPVAIDAAESVPADFGSEEQEPVEVEPIPESSDQVEPETVEPAATVDSQEALEPALVDAPSLDLDVAGEDEPGQSGEPAALESTEPPETETQYDTEDKEPVPVLHEEELPSFDAVELEDFEPDDQSEELPYEQQVVDSLFWREESPAMTPLELGMVVNGRYQVSEVLSAETREVLYRVRDLQRCPQCGFADNNPDQAFCDACGAMLDQKTLALMLERPVGQKEGPVDASAEEHFQEVDRVYWVWRELEQTVPSTDAMPSMRLVVGQKSDVGQKRDLDEDSMFVFISEGTYASATAQLALFVVADGMGGHEGGEVASKLAIQTVASQLLSTVFAPELAGPSLSDQLLQDRVIQAVQQANEQVYLERQKRNTDMGTTLTLGILKDWTLYVAHVGDCRAYRFGENGLQQLTTDHSIVASMVAAGSAEPEEIYTHPQRSVIYRSVGDRPSVSVDWDAFAVEPGDRVVICCDGLWEMIRNEGIEEILMRESDPQAACEIMVDQANVAGGLDNISVIVVQL